MFRRRKRKELTEQHLAAAEEARSGQSADRAGGSEIRRRAVIAALHSSDEFTRRDAAKALEGLGGPGVVDALGALLRDSGRKPDRGTYAAIEVLGALGGEEAEAALTTALGDRRFWEATDLGDHDRYLGAEALARSLGRIGGLPAILRGHLAGAESADEWVRWHNLRELGNVCYRSAPGRPDVYGDGGRVLRETDLELLTAPLRRIAAQDPHGNVRNQAEYVLRMLVEWFPQSSRW